MIIAKDNGAGGNYEPIPAGTIQAVCYGIWDIGMQESAFGKKNKIIIGWEVNQRIDKPESEYHNKRLVISKTYTLSLNEKATLSIDLEGWRGKKFTDEEKKGFDVEKVIGVNCLLNIVHDEKNGKVYANIKSVSKLMAGMPLLKAEIPNTPPEWVVKKMNGVTQEVPKQEVQKQSPAIQFEGTEQPFGDEVAF